MSELEKNEIKTVEEKMKELFDLMDEKAAAGELNEVEDDESFKSEMQEKLDPMTGSEAAAYEYSMMMKQFDAMMEDWNRREAEEKAAEAAAKKAAKEQQGE